MTHRIIIDTGRASTLNSGLGQVVYQFAAELSRQKPPEFEFCFLLHKSMQSTFASDFQFETDVAGVIRRLWPGLFSDGDIWHVLNPDSRSVPLHHPAIITTIHDVRVLSVKNPARVDAYRQQLQGMISHSLSLTAISNYTRQQVREHFKPGEIPFQVVPNGIAWPEDITGSSTEPYLFSIGLFEPKKRLHLLVEMMQYLPDLKLILAGNNSNSYGDQIRAQIGDLGLAEQIQLIGAVNEDLKWRLYKHARALVFPSSLEGFGLPLLEAMATGTPALTSTDAALPETGGQHAHYFPSLNPDDMAGFVKQILAEEADADRQPRIDYARSFSWKKTVSLYLDLYRSLLD